MQLLASEIPLLYFIINNLWSILRVSLFLTLLALTTLSAYVYIKL